MKEDDGTARQKKMGCGCLCNAKNSQKVTYKGKKAGNGFFLLFSLPFRERGEAGFSRQNNSIEEASLLDGVLQSSFHSATAIYTTSDYYELFQSSQERQCRMDYK